MPVSREFPRAATPKREEDITRRNMPKSSSVDQTGRPQPLYQKVKAFIQERIRNGQWPPDSRIPSEHELVRTLSVSRMTVHRALRELTADGRLVRIQGVGTFVAPEKPQSALLEIKSIAEEIGRRGGVHTSKVHLLQSEPAAAELAAAMNLTAGATVFHAILVHSDRDIPIQLADRFVNPACAPLFLEQDFTRITPNEYLLSVAPVTEVEHVIEAVVADGPTQQLLQIAADEPCLVLHRTTWADNMVATRSRFIYSGSRYRLGGRFKPETENHRMVT